MPFLCAAQSIEIVKVPSEFVPGKHQMIIFKVTNHSSEQMHAEVKLDMPKGWSLITAPPKFKLNPNESKRILYTISLPMQVANGNDFFTISLLYDGLEIERKRIDVAIKKIHNVTLEVIERPKYLKEGDEFTCKFLLINKGNVAENIMLSSRKGTIEGDLQFFLPVDSTHWVTIKQPIPKSNKTQIVVNDLSVILKDADSILSKNTPITVYPNQSGKQSIYHTFPVEASFLHHTVENITDKTSFFQYDIQGKGFLDRKEKHYLAWVAKGTNNSGIERFETINRHLLLYKYKKNILQLGDFTFGLSRLLEHVRLGRGALLSMDLGKFNWVTFYNELLFFPSVKNQIGSSLSFKPNNKWNFKFNTIYRTFLNAENNSLALSGFGHYGHQNLLIKAEYANSFQNQKTGHGAFVNTLYKKKSFQLTSDMMFTSKDFQGFYHNTLFKATNLSFSLRKNLSTSFQVNYNFVNPKDDNITAQVAPFNQSYIASLQFSKNKINNHKLSFIYRNNQDRSEIEKFNYSENSLRYSYKYKTDVFNGQLNAEIAATENKMSPEEYVEGISYQAGLHCHYSLKKKSNWVFFQII